MGGLGRAAAGSTAARASLGATAHAPRAHATSRAKPRRVKCWFMGVSGGTAGRECAGPAGHGAHYRTEAPRAPSESAGDRGPERTRVTRPVADRLDEDVLPPLVLRDEEFIGHAAPRRAFLADNERVGERRAITR